MLLYTDTKYNARKLYGMHDISSSESRIKWTEFEFKELLICKILQVNCQMHLLITKVSFKLVNPLQVCARKSGGTK